MNKRLMALTMICTFVFTLCFSFAASMQEVEAGPCEDCWAWCECKGDIYEGRWVTQPYGHCDLHYCGDCFDGPCW